MKFQFIHLFIIVFFVNLIESFALPLTDNSGKYEVAFLTVLFRHGDRTPEAAYPNDPHTDSFNLTGFGRLTVAGKARAYGLGTELRHAYKNFLGEMYIPHEVEARSTDYDRTKMSLMLVLGALYPPRGEQIWNPILNWQPIPTNYVRKKEDFLVGLQSCPSYVNELKNVQNFAEVRQKIERFHPLMANLTQWTGGLVNTSTEMLFLYHTLMAESSMGLELPEWSREIFPKGLLWEAAVEWFEILNYNDKLCRLFSGALLKTAIDAMNDIANGTATNRRKIQLFSAHETNLVSLLITLGVFEPHIPEYSSAVILELLRNKKGQFYVRVVYYLSIPPIMKVLHIPGCDMEFCPLGKFNQLMENLVPKNENDECSH